MEATERKRRESFHILIALITGAFSLAGLQAQGNDQSAATSSGRLLESSTVSTPIALAADSDPAPATFGPSGRYRITPSDVLELRFPYVPEFDQTVTVQPDGYISLRRAGDLRVQGRTLPEITLLLAEAYANILREPVINIVLKEFEKPYFIATGEVVRPGKYELRGATTLTQGLALAGGHTGAAKHSQVILFRRFLAEWLEVKQIDVKKMYAARNLSEDPLLRPGDTIFVPKSTLSKIAPFMPRPGIGLYVPMF
jgi:protein involved in polysaccharide export with SLBB domain